MSTSIGQNNFVNQLEDMVRSFVQEKLETVMKEEMDQFFEENPELKNYKNGSYGRQLDTKYGRIEDLQVPRDRGRDLTKRLVFANTMDGFSNLLT